MLLAARHDAVRRDALDRRLVQIDKPHIVPVEGLVISGLHRDAAGAEAVVLRHQFLCGLRVADALADLAGHEVRDRAVGGFVHEGVAEIAHPDAEARLPVELLVKSFALLGRHLHRLAPVGVVDEAPVRGAAAGEDRVVAGLDPGLGPGVDGRIVQGRAPVGAALEHRQMARRLGHHRDQLHGGGARADDADALAGKLQRLARPVRGVEGGPAEIRHSFDLGHLRDGERADRRDEPAGARAMPVLRLDLPGEPVLVPGRADDPRPEPDIAAQVELVGDEVHIAQGLGLGREMLAPLPFLQQFPGEGKAVAVALGIEARAGIAVPVPGAADIAAGLEHPHPEAKFPEPVKLVEAGNAGADHDGVIVFAVRRPAHAA